MTGAIRKELMDVTKVTPKRGEDDTAFFVRLQKAAAEEIDEDAWNGLSQEAQDWSNQVADAITQKKPLPAFADEKPAEPEKPSTRRRGSQASTPAATAYTPKEGDNVLVTTKRGKVVQGIIVEVTEDLVVLNADGDKGDQANDVEVALEGATITPSNTAEALKIESQAATAGPGAADDAEKAPPGVGDTVQVKTKRGKVIMGTLTAIDDDGFALKDPTGQEHDLAHSQVETFEMKGRAKGNANAEVKMANPDAKPTQRGTGVTGGGAPAGSELQAEKPKRSSNEPGVSVGNRIRDMLHEDPTLTDEQLGAQLAKEKIEFRPPTVKMIAKDARYILAKFPDHKGTKAAASGRRARA